VAREIGESVRDEVFKHTNRFGPHTGPSGTYNERESPARAALRSGEAVSEADAIERAATAVIDEIEDEESRRGRRGPMSGAARRLRGV